MILQWNKYNSFASIWPERIKSFAETSLKLSVQVNLPFSVYPDEIKFILISKPIPSVILILLTQVLDQMSQ